MADPSAQSQAQGVPRLMQVIGILVIGIGVVLLVAGVTTWFTVQNQLENEKITVAEDARYFAGDQVEGPLTAYAQADVIEKHSKKAGGGKTYAQLQRDDPRRQTVMTASFLRASLFTSVVAFGVAAMSMVVGLVLVLIGVALVQVTRALRRLT